MAAAATAADPAAGSRRAVVRSEKFMEWQRELSSTRAAYGARRRNDDIEAAASNGIKKHQRKRHSSDEEAAKGSTGSLSQQSEINIAKAKFKKQQQQQEQPQQLQQSDPNRPQKEEIDSGSKKIMSSKLKEAADPRSVEGGRLQRCKQPTAQAAHTRHPPQDKPAQKIEQQASPTQPTNKRRRLIPSAHQTLQPSKRPAGGQSRVPLDLPSKRGSKRSRRVAKRLANADPPSPPLKLPKLYVTLSRKEIQEDWLKITGQKYSGKPRKSALVQLGLGLGTSLACPSTIRYLNDPQ